MTNLLPNLETSIIDKSLSGVPLDAGSAGFIFAGQWGPVNKTMTIGNFDKFLEMYGEPTYNTNHLSYASISKYFDYGVGAAKTVRGGQDNYTTKNACQVVKGDFLNTSIGNWANGNAQVRKLNMEDDSFESSEYVYFEIDSITSSYTVGDSITDSTSGATGIIDALIEGADYSGTNAYVFVKNNISGYTFSSGDTVTDGGTSHTINNTPVTITRYGIYKTDEIITTGGASEANKVPVGAEIEQDQGGGIVVSATVIHRSGADLHVSEISGGTLNTDNISSVSSLDTSAAASVTVSSTASTSSDVDGIVVYAKYPGTEGNDIQVAMCDSTNFDTAYNADGDKFVGEFDETSLDTDEIAIIVAVDGTVVETNVVSTTPGDTYQGGKVKFIEDFLHEYSDYIEMDVRTSGTYNINTFATSLKLADISLAGGACQGITSAEAENAYDELLKKENKVRVVSDFHELSDMSNYTTVLNHILAKANVDQRYIVVSTAKKDFISTSSFSISDASTVIGNYTNCKFHWPFYEWFYFNDSLLKRKYYIPSTGDHVGVLLRTMDNFSDITAPAGIRYGTLSGITKMYYNLERGNGSATSQLYQYGWNSDVYEEDNAGNVGYYVWGIRSDYDSRSSLSRVQVSNSLITDKMELESRLKPYLFSEISEETYALIRNDCDAGYLQNRANEAFDTLDDDGGYVFICDTSNNDANARNNGTIYVDFMVKYKKAAEYIKLRITVTKSGIEFSEI